VKLTFNAVMFLGLALGAVQSVPAIAPTNAPRHFRYPNPNGNKANSSIFAASASSRPTFGR